MFAIAFSRKQLLLVQHCYGLTFSYVDYLLHLQHATFRKTGFAVASTARGKQCDGVSRTQPDWRTMQ